MLLRSVTITIRIKIKITIEARLRFLPIQPLAFILHPFFGGFGMMPRTKVRVTPMSMGHCQAKSM